MCAHALVLGGVQSVVYGCDNDKFGGNGSILSLHRLFGQEQYQVTRGVLKEEAITLL
jgi:tRNA-specific adenosine deaminase 2